MGHGDVPHRSEGNTPLAPPQPTGGAGHSKQSVKAGKETRSMAIGGLQKPIRKYFSMAFCRAPPPTDLSQGQKTARPLTKAISQIWTASNEPGDATTQAAQQPPKQQDIPAEGTASAAFATSTMTLRQRMPDCDLGDERWGRVKAADIPPADALPPSPEPLREKGWWPWR